MKNRSGKAIFFITALLVLTILFSTVSISGTTEEPQPTPTPQEETGPATGTQEETQENPETSTPTEEPGTSPVEETGVPTEPTEEPEKTEEPGESEEPEVSQEPDETEQPTPQPTKTPTPIPTRTPRPTDPPLPSEVPSVPSIIDETPTPTPSFEGIEPGGEPKPQKDNHGYIIRIAAWWDELKSNKNIASMIKEFEKKYNCQVQFLDMNQKKIWDLLLESKATGRPYIDAVFLEAHDVMGKMAPYGLLAPINPYLTEKEIDAIPESYLRILSGGKNLYAIPAKAPSFSGLWINEDYLTSLRVPSIYELYSNNEWTWEKFNKIMYDTTIDADNSGYYEKFGITVGVDLYPGLIASAGGNIISWDGSAFHVGIHSNRTYSALEFARKIHTTGYVAHESEKFFYIYRSGILTGESWMASKVKQYLKANHYFVPYPAPSSDFGYRALATSAPVIALVESSQHKEETAELIKLLYGQEKFEEEKKNATKDFNKPTANVYENMMKNFTVDFSKAFVDNLTFRQKIMADLTNRTGFTQKDVEKKYFSQLQKAVEARFKPIKLERLPVAMEW